MFVTCGNASQAYRLVYDCEGSNPATINRQGWALTHHAKIAPRIKDLQQLHEKGVMVTRPVVQAKLLELMEDEDSTVAMAACRELAKHLGLHQTNIKHTVEGELNHRHLHLEALKMVNGRERRSHELQMAEKAERNTRATQDAKLLEYKDI